jgi:hypothetical protein
LERRATGKQKKKKTGAREKIGLTTPMTDQRLLRVASAATPAAEPAASPPPLPKPLQIAALP